MWVDFHDIDGYVHAKMSGKLNQNALLTTFKKTLLYLSSKRMDKVLFDDRELDGHFKYEQLMMTIQKLASIQPEYNGSYLGYVSMAVITSNEKIKLMGASGHA